MPKYYVDTFDRPKSDLERNRYFYLGFFYFFSLFFPFPAIPVGNYTGIQCAHILSFLFLFLFFSEVFQQKRALFIYFALIVPPVVSLAVDPSNTVNLNGTAGMVLALLVIIIASLFLVKSFVGCLSGAFWAIGIHSIVGLIQQWFYLSENFPFLDLYINPSFSPIDDGVTWKIYALYTKRSFGLMPEPSAMFASISPWLVLLTAMLFEVRKKIIFYFKSNAVYFLIVVLGFILIFLGRSGGTPVLLVGIAPILYRYTVFNVKSGSVKGWIAFLLVLSAFSFGAYYIYDDIQDRVADEVSKAGSWEERTASIIYSLEALLEGDLINAIAGYGIGAIAQMTYAATGTSSVHSWIFGYIMGTGMIGFFVLCIVFYYIIYDIARSPNAGLGFSLVFIWIFCATFVTGYLQLLAMWGALALLINWRRVS